MSEDQAGMAPGNVVHGNTTTTPGEAELPEDVRRAISLAGQRATKERLRQAIMKACEWKPHTAGEMAILLKRNKSYLADNHLSQMVDEGLLDYLYPDMPKHPHQGYRAKARGNHGQ